MKNSNTLLSVIIPAYNAAGTIESALDFIKKHKTSIAIEVIVINDGSTDNTKQVCETFIKNHKKKNVTVKLVNQKNLGHGSAINYGIKNAKGKYLRVLDADDYFAENTFDRYLDFLSGCDSDLVCSDYSEVREEEEKRLYWHDGKKSFINREFDNVISRSSPYLLPCATVKTSVLREAHTLIDEKCRYDDQEYDYLIIECCRTVSYFATSIYKYVVGNVEQSVSQESLKKNVRDHQKVVEWLVRRYYSKGLTGNKKDFVFNRILVPLCYYQYFIAVRLKKSRKDFLSFDEFLKEFRELYSHLGVAGRRLRIHRVSKGLFI